MLLVDLYIVKNMVGSESNRCPFCHLLFGIDHVICAVAEQKLRLHVAFGAGYHAFCAQLFQQRGGFQRVLEVAADGHKANVKISDTERTQELRIGAVADLCVGDKRKHIVDPFLIGIDCHDLMPQLRELHGDMPPEAACSDQ